MGVFFLNNNILLTNYSEKKVNNASYPKSNTLPFAIKFINNVGLVMDRNIVILLFDLSVLNKSEYCSTQSIYKPLLAIIYFLSLLNYYCCQEFNFKAF